MDFIIWSSLCKKWRGSKSLMTVGTSWQPRCLVWAFFASAGLNSDKISDWFDKFAGSELAFQECMGYLLIYSFIDSKTESSSFSIHSVFHHQCFHAFEEKNTITSRLALMSLASAAPLKTVPHYLLIQWRLLPHCDGILSWTQQRMQESLIDKTEFWW